MAIKITCLSVEEDNISAVEPIQCLKPGFIGGLLASVTLLFYWTYIASYPTIIYQRIATNRTTCDNTNHSLRDPALHLRNNANKSKIIVVWSGVYTFLHAENQTLKFGRRECTFTRNRRLLADSDAVIMVNGYIKADDLPQTRFPWQRWIFKMMEPPSSSNQTEAYRDTVNRKSRKILWFISNCGFTYRIRYAQQLQKLGLQVDIFGGCGKPDPCNREHSCMEKLYKKYKFYLAFENSKCEDYITEKAWRALSNYLVPIVMGTTIRNYEETLPPNSFIHVDNFTGPRELATYLTLLMEDNEAYSRYHEWRQYYQIITPSCHEHWMRRLCSKLYEDFTGQSYLYTESFWSTNMCNIPGRAKNTQTSKLGRNFTWSKWRLYK